MIRDHSLVPSQFFGSVPRHTNSLANWTKWLYFDWRKCFRRRHQGNFKTCLAIGQYTSSLYYTLRRSVRLQWWACVLPQFAVRSNVTHAQNWRRTLRPKVWYSASLVWLVDSTQRPCKIVNLDSDFCHGKMYTSCKHLFTILKYNTSLYILKENDAKNPTSKTDSEFQVKLSSFWPRLLTRFLRKHKTASYCTTGPIASWKLLTSL